MKNHRGLLAFLLAWGLAPAQVNFTVTATANSTAQGYTAGQVVNFTFVTTGADVSGYGSNRFFSYVNTWAEELTTETPLFTAAAGTGVVGPLERPALNLGDPLSYIEAQAPGGNQLTLLVGAEAPGSHLGLTLNGLPVTGLMAGSLDWGQAFAMPEAFTPLPAYFAPHLGPHALLPGGYATIYLAGGATINFTASALTISVVPEPAVAALGAGLAGLLAAGAWRRRPRPGA